MLPQLILFYVERLLFVWPKKNVY